MSAQVSNITSSASYAIRNISKIRNYLDRASTEKLVHACVTSRLQFETNEYQSAYTNFRSTETALLKMSNDLHSTMNRKEVSALTLLDLSAAFDTIDLIPYQTLSLV